MRSERQTRARLFERCPELRDFELRACRLDVVYWLTKWVWTYDPRLSGDKHIPFIPFPKQEQFLKWLEERESKQENGLVEKSRDAGVSWLCIAFAVHRWLFVPGHSIGFGSRKELYVDRAGDADSLFEKIRILLERLPTWMLPKGFKIGEHATFMKIVNPVNGSTITGEAGDNIGRGGRKGIFFVDEAAFIERPHLIERSLSATTNCRIDVSTPNGIGNTFYAKRFSSTVPVFTFSWRDDKRKDDAWYAEMKRKYDPVTIAQEIDIDYTASVEGVCIPAEWVRAAVDLDVPESGPVIAGFDVAEEGVDLCVETFRRGPKVRKPVDWGKTNTTQSAYRVVDDCTKEGVATLYYDADGPGVGPKGTWASMERKPPFEIVPVHNGEPASDTVRWPDGQTSAEKFSNRKAELWWMLRCRFERTYEHVNKIKTYPLDELISIPNHPQLIAELSIPKVEYNEKGKIQIESKKSLRGRGVKSPDFAESLVLCFTPERPKKRLYLA